MTTSSKRDEPPRWAVLQQLLLAEMDRGWRTFERHCTEPDGRVRFRDTGQLDARDAGDDFYENFFNWPMLYLLGGADDLLESCKRHWEATTRQLTELGKVHDEYEVGYDWFHQGEGNLFFYGICMADPDDEAFISRAGRFAGLYLGGPPGNYDPAVNIIRAPHTGSRGPRWGLTDPSPIYPWNASYRRYGLPLDWIDGIHSFEQLLADHDAAVRMGQEMFDRMGRGDVAVNLAATSLALNAYLMTGERAYREWMLHYTEGWWQRASENRGIIPDNVGLDGVVGEYLGGRWYGGHYGWSFPHGVTSIGPAVVIAGDNAALLTGDDSHRDPARALLDLVVGLGEVRPFSTIDEEIRDIRRSHLPRSANDEAFMIPTRRSDAGWFDYQPPTLTLWFTLWAAGKQPQDLERIRALRVSTGYEWGDYVPFRNKGEEGHHQPWFAFLEGDNPAYPEESLEASIDVVRQRIRAIETDESDPGKIDDAHYQALNPVVTETLLQQMCGAPQVLYNGGLAEMSVRYFDRRRGRAGLPAGVSALVRSVDHDETILELVNLTPQRQWIVIQCGALAQDAILAATFAPAPCGALPPAHVLRELLLSQGVELQADGARAPIVLDANEHRLVRLSVAPGVLPATYAKPADIVGADL